jgi:hypothetical protein
VPLAGLESTRPIPPISFRKPLFAVSAAEWQLIIFLHRVVPK